MPGIIATATRQPPLAQDGAPETPVQEWFSGWLAYLSANLPVLFVVLTLLVGTLLLVRGGGFKQALSFAAGAVVIFVILMNLELFAGLLRDELPLQPPAMESPAPPVESPGPGE